MTTQTIKKTRQAPRYRIKTTRDGDVVLRYTDSDGIQRLRMFWCPEDGGYVSQRLSCGELRQVCDMLGVNGDTLRCETRADLAGVIRREHRAYLRTVTQ
jgi:hypothetical protein